MTAISNEARALNAATSGISLDRQLAQIEDAAQAYRNSGMVGSTGDSQNYDTSSPNGATAGQANYLGADGRLYDSPQQSVVITGKRMTPEESAAYDAEQARARLDQATNDQITAGTYNRFSAIGNALRNRDYSVAWFHVNHEASDAAKQATRDRMYPQQSPAMARLDRMLSSPIGATASVVGRMFGASQNTQDALLATGALAEQLAGAGTGVYKQTLTATPPMATVLGSRPRGVGSYPLGFSTQSEFAAFGNSLYSGLESAGFRNVRAGFQGSSVTGRAYKAPNLPFDAGRLSDYDVALSSSELFGQAQAIGMGLRQQGMRTGPLLPEHLDRLGLTEVSNQLSLQAGRPVKFMIYRSIDDAAGRSPTIPVPRDQP